MFDSYAQHNFNKRRTGHRGGWAYCGCKKGLNSPQLHLTHTIYNFCKTGQRGGWIPMLKKGLKKARTKTQKIRSEQPGEIIAEIYELVQHVLYNFWTNDIKIRKAQISWYISDVFVSTMFLWAAEVDMNSSGRCCYFTLHRAMSDSNFTRRISENHFQRLTQKT